MKIAGLPSMIGEARIFSARDRAGDFQGGDLLNARAESSFMAGLLNGNRLDR
jgi:hypothetical protein